jgi:glycerol-3-phosphate acyltransferase PlsY
MIRNCLCCKFHCVMGEDNMEHFLRVSALAIGAYFLGSIPFSILITRWQAEIDVREVGSGHATATNTMRAAGWTSGIAVALLDAAKGFLAVWLAKCFAVFGWEPAVAAAIVVIGHCWPIYAGFRGGMGVASGAGALLATWPLGLVLAVGLGVACQLIIKHSARGNSLTGLLVGPLWLIFGASGYEILLVVVVGLILAYRARIDWQREYRELWWDRE